MRCLTEQEESAYVNVRMLLLLTRTVTLGFMFSPLSPSELTDGSQIFGSVANLGGTPLTPIRALERLTLITPLTGVRGPSNAVRALDGPVWGCFRYASYSFENFMETNHGYSESLSA